VSVYGKDPSVPPEDYEGYEAELAEFEKHGSRHYKSLDANREPGDGALTDEERREAARARRREAENRGAEGGDPLGNLGLEDWDDDDDPLHSDERDHAAVGGVRSDDEDDAAAFVDRDEDGRPLHNQLPGGIGARALALGYNPRTAEDPVLDPGLYLVGTPIGNLEDITLRALRVLRSADAVLCEDTRHTKRLLARYSIEPLRLVSYHAHNERRRREPLLDKMRRGASLALVSDAGTPGVADPGADLAAACAEEGIAVRPIPGPSAAAAAVAVAGIPVDEGFTFCGFLPPKSGARRKKLETLRPIKGSLVAFVPPHKLVNTLKDFAEVLGDRNCCVCREMTKVHEEFRRGTLSEAIAEFETRQPRGEITLVVEGSRGAGEKESDRSTGAGLELALKEMMDAGTSPSEASKRAASELGAKKKEAYALALKLAGK